MPYVVRKISGTNKYGVYKVVGKGADHKLELKSKHASKSKAMGAIAIRRAKEHNPDWQPTGKK